MPLVIAMQVVGHENKKKNRKKEEKEASHCHHPRQAKAMLALF
jgi:hypothetical protein